mmetsp:Transcript_28650/g.73164  ORF Transcript_28650/g.73164 Transcript_28650/m.73164 type:complete len:111 (-) Transcript_28650:275-607(-)
MRRWRRVESGKGEEKRIAMLRIRPFSTLSFSPPPHFSAIHLCPLPLHLPPLPSLCPILPVFATLLYALFYFVYIPPLPSPSPSPTSPLSRSRFFLLCLPATLRNILISAE